MAEDVAPPYALVVIGASAGGIEALSVLVGSLPADFAAPIVIAQHLDPSRPSHLGDILGQQGALPVRTVTDRERLEPGVVFVVPTSRHVGIEDHQVFVHADSAHRPQPSVDLLFRTATRVYGERLIAVVLTGTGSDGAAGAREVKQAGGTVIIQNPDTAAFPGMPESLAPTTVDIVANLDSIGSLLTDLVSGAAMPPPPGEDRTLTALLDELRDQSGIDFASYKAPTIMRRLHRRLVATGSDSLNTYIRYLQSHPEEYQRLVSSFLIKVTEFFRDPELFAYLSEQVLPQIVAEARRRGNDLRLWSAGCATGEEAYSLAIALAEVLGDDLERFHVRLFATDLDADAVAFARRGIYPAAALANLPPDLVARHFTEMAGEYEIKKRVRSLTVFGQHDLGQRAPFPRIDLALCRNVLIYFTTDLQKRALQLFAFSLRDGGYLVLGKSETTKPLSEFFTQVQPDLRVYRRQGDRLLIPPARIKDATPLVSGRLVTRRRLAAVPDVLRDQRGSVRSPTSTERLAALLLDLPIGVVLVDRRYDIQVINNAARRLLGIHGTAIGEDVIHLARAVPSEWLRNAIDAALGGATPDSDDVVTVDDATGDHFHYRVTCVPYRHDDQGGGIEIALIVVVDVTDLVEARRGFEQALQRAHEGAERQQQEMASLTISLQRLADTNRNLLGANQELTAANAELRSTNEEFMVGSEEAQAATEEVETLNEELQATNEELETLNEELQATVEELNTTNDDLQARSVELQELAVTLQAQRRESEMAREGLEAILHEMGDAVLVVDGEARPVLTNRAYAELFGGEHAELTAEDQRGQPLPPELTPQRRAAQLESFSMEFTLGNQDGSRRWFEANGRPVRGAGNAQLGVLVIRDITERSLRHLQEQFVAMTSHELRTPLTGLQAALQQVARHLARDPAQASTHHLVELGLSQVRRLDLLTRDLADLARLRTGRLRLDRQPVDLAALVGRVAESVGFARGGHTFSLDLGVEPMTVDGDPMRLEQVVTNLLTNAVVHAPESERTEVRLRREDGEAVLEVQDHGPGIAADVFPSIFAPFYQVTRDDTSRGGMGLGLYISKELIEAHGGHIAVASAAGEGTTFTVRLPLQPDAEEHREGGDIPSGRG